MNKKGEKSGHPFKSSLFGKNVGIKALEKRIEKSAEVIKDKGLKERSKRVISAAMRTCKNRSDFEKTLSKQGISAIFRINDEGRIYGATFIDHEQKCVFNGSRLGKEFSANVFQELFNGTDNHHEQSEQSLNSSNSLNSFNEKENSDTGIGSLFDIFLPEGSASDEIQEEAFTRRMKKKKRKKRIN